MSHCDAWASGFGIIVEIARAFDNLFSKTKYPVRKASYGILNLTVRLKGNMKHTIFTRLCVCIKRNASIRHVTYIRIPIERPLLPRLF